MSPVHTYWALFLLGKKITEPYPLGAHGHCLGHETLFYSVLTNDFPIRWPRLQEAVAFLDALGDVWEHLLELDFSLGVPVSLAQVLA